MSLHAANCSSIKQLRRKFLATAGLLLLTSCLGTPRTGNNQPTPLTTQVHTLALTRTTWDGTRPDSFCQPDIGDNIRWQMKQSLLALGYQVNYVRLPALDNSNRPDPVAGWSGAQLSQQIGPATDGIFRMRIVEYLDASLCDTGFESKSLGITAVAEIFASNDGQLLWQTRQSCSDTSGQTSEVADNCSFWLVKKIARQLPPAPSPVKSQIVGMLELGPGGDEVFVPGHESLVVVGAKVMPAIENE